MSAARRGFVQCGYFADKGGGDSSDADVRTFWRKFRNLWCARTDKGEGVEPLRTQEMVSFSQFCADVLFRRSLSSFDPSFNFFKNLKWGLNESF